MQKVQSKLFAKPDTRLCGKVRPTSRQTPPLTTKSIITTTRDFDNGFPDVRKLSVEKNKLPAQYTKCITTQDMTAYYKSTGFVFRILKTTTATNFVLSQAAVKTPIQPLTAPE